MPYKSMNKYLWIPISIINQNSISSLKIDTYTTSSNTVIEEQKDHESENINNQHSFMHPFIYSFDLLH